MKSKQLILLACATLFLSLNVLAQSRDTIAHIFHDSLLCLEINGKITNINNADNNRYKAVLIHYNTPVDSSVVKGNKSFRFRLVKDAYYAIKIYKEGYAPKLISINTHIPKENIDDEAFRLDIKTELIPEKEFNSLNEEAKDFPIAIVMYIKSKNGFSHNEKYTYNIKKTLYQK